MASILEHIADALEVGLEDGGGDDNSVEDLTWERKEIVPGLVDYLPDQLSVIVRNGDEVYLVSITGPVRRG